jgi:hypothetical protein
VTPILATDLGPVLARTVRDGAAHEPGVLAEPWRAALLDEVGAETYAELPPVEGPHGVRQQGEYRVLTGSDVPPAVAAVREAVVRALGVAAWWPDEITVQRYAPGSTGVSTHLDGRRHAHLVAILTLEGSAVLRQCADREGTTVRAWDADAGSLVLLRGPGLDGVADGRPLHAVDGPVEGRRTSLTLRSTPGG